MIKKIIFLIIACIFYVNLNSVYPIIIKGNHIIWSTEDENEFLYSVYGKSTGKKIWKIYNIKEKTGITLFYDTGVVPVWSFDGKKIVTARKDKVDIYFSPDSKKSYTLAADEVVDIDLSYNGKKIVYSDGTEIYLLDLETGENSLLGKGKKPAFINKDKAIIFFNEEFFLSAFDKNLQMKVITTNFIKNVFPFKTSNKIVFQDTDSSKIKLFDLDLNVYKEIIIVDENDEIIDFSVSPDNNFLIYILKNGGLYLVHIPTHLKIKILNEYGIFTPKISKNNKYCSYEKENQIYIKEISNYIKAFNFDKIFKVNMGASQGITIGTSIEVYEERKNPFTGEVIGMDVNKFKGVLKVITVYDSYCYCKIDEEFKTDKSIEINDIAYWKEKNVMGVVTR